jgi:hypothetical protein
MTTIIASKATVYRVNGKGRGWRSKSAAYRHAAIAILNEACVCAPGDEDQPFGDTCRLCKRTCEKHRSRPLAQVAGRTSNER